ncbi:tol-pal system protein YbgF [Hyphomicrobium sp. CS1GBMeth3]|uniref:tol-pal system protein YbgF n=1 Tax=Hyphomicrobium sp. CS1GBMeth3 TaxID=1892845 RepID=UPI0009FB9086|nr:tol-pal system protein YbgF [Hyphomicrobium sp. CS1GBMeth3]
MQSKPVPTARAARGAACLMLALLWGAGGAVAQGVVSEELPTVKGAQGKAQQKGPAGGGDAGLRERVEQLEGQLVDLQVVIGTLESLARTGGTVSAPARSDAGGGGLGGGDRARLDSLETQIRALTAQVEQLSQEFRAGGGPQRRSELGGFEEPPQASRFGSTTVTSDTAGPQGLDDPGAGFGPPQPGPNVGAPPPATYGGPTPPPTYGSESLPPAAGGGQLAAIEPGGGMSSKQLYETAYGYLLQQDYGAAQAGFRDFLKSHPQDPLAPNALYWLGESHYVQRNYADAAEAFDLVVSAYGSSSKAPDAQLKHGMSLAQLGKRQDACATLRGVGSKFPNAPVQIKAKADSERQRIGCP